MLRIIVLNAARFGIVATARHVLATDVRPVVDRRIAEVRLAANGLRAESTLHALSVWSFRSPSSFFPSRSDWLPWFVRSTILNVPIR